MILIQRFNTLKLLVMSLLWLVCWMASDSTLAWAQNNQPLTTTTPITNQTGTSQSGISQSGLTAGQTLLRTIYWLNVRTGPGLDYPAIKRLDQGVFVTVTVKSTDTEWWLLADKVNGQEGWISSNPTYTLVIAEAAPATETPTPTAPPTTLPTPTITTTSTPTPVPTATATKTKSPTPLPSPSPTATRTSAPTASPTASATVAPALGNVVTATPVAAQPAMASPAVAIDASLFVQLDVSGNVVTFSNEGRWLALSTLADEIQLLETATWQVRWRSPQDGRVDKLLFSPDSQRLVSTSWDGVTSLWEVASGALLGEFRFAQGTSVADFSADNQWLATGGVDGKVIVAHANNGEIVAELQNDLPVRDLALSPQGPWVALVTAASWAPVEVVVWDIFTHEQRSLVRVNGLTNYSNVVFSPDTKWLAVALHKIGEARPAIFVWQTQTWPQVARLEVENRVEVAQRLAFSPDGFSLAGAVGRDLQLWNVVDWQPTVRLVHPNLVRHILFSPSSQLLATTLIKGDLNAPDNVVLLWEVRQGTAVGRITLSAQVSSIAFSPDERSLAVSAGADPMTVWRIK